MCLVEDHFVCVPHAVVRDHNAVEGPRLVDDPVIDTKLRPYLLWRAAVEDKRGRAGCNKLGYEARLCHLVEHEFHGLEDINLLCFGEFDFCLSTTVDRTSYVWSGSFTEYDEQHSNRQSY